MVDIAAIPEPVAIDLERTAIVVVDMQNAFASKGGMLDLAGKDISYAPGVIDVHATLLDRARAAGVKIVYLAMTYNADLSNAGGPSSPNYQKEFGIVLMREHPELGQVLIDGSWDWQIVDALAPQPGDLLVRMYRYSGFVGTHLDSYLRSEGIRNLLFTGIRDQCLRGKYRARRVLSRVLANSDRRRDDPCGSGVLSAGHAVEFRESVRLGDRLESRVESVRGQRR